MHSMTDSLPPRLTAAVKGSFAYDTVRVRLPTILTRVIDDICRKIQSKECALDKADMKAIMSAIVELKHEMWHNKPFAEISDDAEDALTWNAHIRGALLEESTSNPPAWFTSPWLFAECYMYRRIYNIIKKTSTLQTYDVFSDQKQAAFFGARDSISRLCDIIGSFRGRVGEDYNDQLKAVAQFSLWSNKADLSMHAAATPDALAKLQTALEDFGKLAGHIIANCLPSICIAAQNMRTNAGIVDIVLDNAGYELVADLCLGDWLIFSGTALTVRFHLKERPWFVSDACRSDFAWTLEQVASIGGAADACASRWKQYLIEKSWILDDNIFWTSFHDFSAMPRHAPSLYAELAASTLVVLKGDLNYRKLVGDRTFPVTTPVRIAAGQFQPRQVWILRTLKADVVVGLEHGKADELNAMDVNWMVSGEFGVIQQY
eukprot:Opistho-2@59316